MMTVLWNVMKPTLQLFLLRTYICASANVEILDEADVMLSASVQERNVFACKKKSHAVKKKAAERSAKAHKELATKLNGYTIRYPPPLYYINLL